MATSPSPPVTPIHHAMSPINTSPTHSYRGSYRRRNSSFSSNHDRSPTTPRSRHRFSNASINSNELPTPGEDGGGMGNLADELEDLDDDEYEEDIADDDVQQRVERGEEDAKEARDSGIDVSYNSRTGSPKHVRNFSKPFSSPGKPPEREEEDDAEERLSPDLEDLLKTVARMTSYAGGSDDPLIPRTIGLLQDLGNQTSLEGGAQRLNTSANAVTTYLASQRKSMQALSTSLYTPLAFSAALDPAILEETMPLIDALIRDLPRPDADSLQGLQKLTRETENAVQTLSQLMDTLQMGKQTTTAAARHLRSTQMVVAELRRERERADDARLELASASARAWEEKVRGKWCASECRNIVSGFDSLCEDLRGQLSERVGAAG